MTLSRVCVAAFALAALAGCGARSTLETSAGSSSASAASSGSSSSGGACSPLRLTPSVGVAAPPGRQLTPTLVATGADGAGVTIAFARTPPGMPGGPAQVLHASFDPWGAWPDAAVGPVHVAAEGGASLAAASEADGSLALLFGGPSPALETPGGVTLDLGLDPDQDGLHAPLVIDPDANAATFVAPRPAHLVGFERRRPLMPFGKAHQLDIGVGHTVSTGTAFVGPLHLGCATNAIAAAAVPAEEGGWLVALTNGTPLGEIGCFEDVAIGPATQIQVALVDPLLGVEQRSSWGSLPEPGTFQSGMAAIALAPRPGGGAWLAWNAAATGAGTEAALRVASIGPAGEWLSDVSVTDHIDTAEGGEPGEAGFAAVALGDRLALVWLYLPDVTFDVAPLLVVEIVGADGTVAGWTLVPTEGAIGLPPALIASPAGDALLVAWSAAPTPGQDERLHAVRVDCLPGG
jgi:hypothetical protein